MEPELLLESVEDASVNFVEEAPDGGKLEARYVRRVDDYFVVYLSSQTGCEQFCRMCHLTATGQTYASNASPEDYFRQADLVLEWYDEHAAEASVVHFNFMARGEVLANPHMVERGEEILLGLQRRALRRGLYPRFLLSTILPKAVEGVDLASLFRVVQPELYYSIYSLDPAFRRRWLPNAIEGREGLCMLKTYQDRTRKLLKLHWAFIAGENDSPGQVDEICAAVRDLGLHVDVNIVRYNPYSDKQGTESEEETIEALGERIGERLPEATVQVVKRVGFDVKASCGMFVEGPKRRRSKAAGELAVRSG